MPAHLVNLINADSWQTCILAIIINIQLNKDNYDSEIKWMAQDLFSTEKGDRLSWKVIYYMSFKTTLDSHLRSFQFKIIN